MTCGGHSRDPALCQCSTACGCDCMVDSGHQQVEVHVDPKISAPMSSSSTLRWGSDILWGRISMFISPAVSGRTTVSVTPRDRAVVSKWHAGWPGLRRRGSSGAVASSCPRTPLVANGSPRYQIREHPCTQLCTKVDNSLCPCNWSFLDLLRLSVVHPTGIFNRQGSTPFGCKARSPWPCLQATFLG